MCSIYTSFFPLLSTRFSFSRKIHFVLESAAFKCVDIIRSTSIHSSQLFSQNITMRGINPLVIILHQLPLLKPKLLHIKVDCIRIGRLNV
mmetsp:Transcript_15621/g.31758  ORF Transcript_15621/g.31758 Transcript_15621/m.31758 type:complete len:90 (-) Transcript_15621:428-697(-)